MAIAQVKATVNEYVWDCPACGESNYIEYKETIVNCRNCDHPYEILYPEVKNDSETILLKELNNFFDKTRVSRGE